MFRFPFLVVIALSTAYDVLSYGVRFSFLLVWFCIRQRSSGFIKFTCNDRRVVMQDLQV